MNYYYNEDTRTFTVECDNDEQHEQLANFLNEMYHDHLVYTYIPSINRVSCLLQCFESLGEAQEAAQKEVNKLSSSDCYTFYEVPLNVWECEVTTHEDIARMGKIVTIECIPYNEA